jgi:hypothetical protein
MRTFILSICLLILTGCATIPMGESFRRIPVSSDTATVYFYALNPVGFQDSGCKNGKLICATLIVVDEQVVAAQGVGTYSVVQLPAGDHIIFRSPYNPDNKIAGVGASGTRERANVNFKNGADYFIRCRAVMHGTFVFGGWLTQRCELVDPSIGINEIAGYPLSKLPFEGQRVR